MRVQLRGRSEVKLTARGVVQSFSWFQPRSRTPTIPNYEKLKSNIVQD